jgi:hypothetical protein
MSIVPVSCLSSAEMSLLGRNLAAEVRKDRAELAAVNRTLAVHDVQVRRLYRPGTTARRRSASLRLN